MVSAPAVRSASHAIRSLVLEYLSLLGASVSEVEPDLFRVELDRERAAELEGDSLPAWMWTGGPDRPAQITYYFTFTPETAEKHAEAELIGPNSHRLQQVVESIRRIARAARAYVPLHAGGFTDEQIPAALRAGRPHREGSVRYRPFFFLCLRLDPHGSAEPSRLFHVAVDRVDRLPLRQLAEVLPRLPLAGGTPHDLGLPVEEPASDLDEAFRIAYDELLETLRREDAPWAQEALSAVEQERERLLGYFAACERDGLDVSEERGLRLAELERMRPRLFVRLQGVCEAYLPVRVTGPSVELLALQARAHDGSAPPRLGARSDQPTFPMPFWR